MIPRIRVDFNGFGNEPVVGDFVSLDSAWTKGDMDRLDLEFRNGLKAIFYEYEGTDEKGEDIFTWAEGVMEYSSKLGWIAKIGEVFHSESLEGGIK